MMRDFAPRVSSNKKRAKKTRTVFRSKNKNKPVFNKKIIITLLSISLLIIYTSFYLFDSNLEIFEPGPISENKVSITFPEKLKEQNTLIEIKEVLDKSNCTYFLQVEAYGKEKFASEMLYKLRSMDLEPYLEEINNMEKKLYGVMLGPYLNKSDVNNAREVIIRIGLSPLIKTKCVIQ